MVKHAAVRATTDSFWTGLAESLAVYAAGAILVLAVMKIPGSGSSFWGVPVVAFAGSLWIAVWHSSHGRRRGARGAYTGTIGFLVLVLIGILTMFAWAFRHIHVSM